ncbi:MAG: redoxin domain-containing protein [Myxococcota bacterium]
MTIVAQKAPAWSGKAFINGEKVGISSEDYAGKWVVMFWWPFSFTGICQSEVAAFEALKSEFDSSDIEVVGFSCDSVHAVAAWTQSDAFPNGVNIPLVGDATHDITKAFGFYSEAIGCAYRATAIVNPDGVVVSASANFLPVARDPKDVLTTARAFQLGQGCTVSQRPA